MIIFVRTRSMLLFGCVVILSSGSAGGFVRQQATGEEEIKAAIRDLSAVENKSRLAAEQRVFEIGKDAIPYLISLLQDLLEHPVPRYVIGKEAEGEQRYRELIEAERKDNRQRLEAAMRRYGSLEISYELENRVIQLLGRLRAQQAVPLLIKPLGCCETGVTIGRIEYTSAMKALTQIGSPAVPKLIEVLQQDHLETSKQPAAGNSKKQKEEARASAVYRRQKKAQALLVLRDIGDPVTLPYLEDLLSTTRDSILVSEIQQTIDGIKRKN